MREEWILNIIYDLKILFLLIKGYVEFFIDSSINYLFEKVYKYVLIMLKNIEYINIFINDLKLIY